MTVNLRCSRRSVAINRRHPAPRSQKKKGRPEATLPDFVVFEVVTARDGRGAFD